MGSSKLLTSVLKEYPHLTTEQLLALVNSINFHRSMLMHDNAVLSGIKHMVVHYSHMQEMEYLAWASVANVDAVDLDSLRDEEYRLTGTVEMSAHDRWRTYSRAAKFIKQLEKKVIEHLKQK